MATEAHAGNAATSHGMPEEVGIACPAAPPREPPEGVGSGQHLDFAARKLLVPER